MRDLEAGTAAFLEALRLAPDLPGVRQALAKATAQMEGRGSANATALVEQYRMLLHGQLSPEERFEIICKIGRLQHEELNDQAAALGTYLQAAQLRPSDVGVLHELVEIHSANRHWSRAVDVLERLVSITSGRDKVCYLGALASILNGELDSPIEAVALYERALEEDPRCIVGKSAAFSSPKRICNGNRAIVVASKTRDSSARPTPAARILRSASCCWP